MDEKDELSPAADHRAPAGKRSSAKARLALIGRCALLLVVALAIAFEALSLLLAHAESSRPLPPTFGNFPRVRALVKDDGSTKPFYFGVMSDPQQMSGGATFPEIVRRLKDEPLSFMVIVGDGVHEGTPEHHAYWKWQWKTMGARQYPVFYLVGNHDIAPPGSFSLADFEKEYGPTNFAFTYRGCLFIMLRVLPLPHSLQQALDYLRPFAEKGRSAYRKVFVFMHVPLPIASETEWHGRTMDKPKELFGLLMKLRPDYVFSGDYHGYGRLKFRDTVFFTIGGGGGKLKKSKFGSFHHALVLKVGPESVAERIMQVNEQWKLKNYLARMAFVKVQPWINRNRLAAALLNVAALALCALSFPWTRGKLQALLSQRKRADDTRQA